MRRLAVIASVFLDGFLLASLAAWWWFQRQPVASPLWRLPVALAVLAIASGAVALIACRRGSLVTLFLVDFSTVALATWWFDHIWIRVAVTHPFTAH